MTDRMLEGSLVRLRAAETRDLDFYFSWLNDPEITRWLDAAALYPLSRSAAEHLEKAGREPSAEHLLLVIETLSDRRAIGFLSLDYEGLESRRALLDRIVIGEAEYRSQGHGTDSLAVLLRFAFEAMNLNRVWLFVHEDNVGAIACYRKCGFVDEGRLRQGRYRSGRYVDTLVMGVLAADFTALKGGTA